MTKILSKDDSRHTKDDSRHTIENNMESNYIKKYQRVIPAEAFVTTDYREFCRIIKDRFIDTCLLYTSPSPRDRQKSRMPSSA